MNTGKRRAAMSTEVADLRVKRGKHVPHNAPIAVVVMSTHSDPLTKSAVKSLIENGFPVEIAVVNTGFGSLEEALREFEDDLVLVETPKQHFAGGTRNLGIRYTRARVVAFLAADCTVPTSWLSLRVAGHEKSRTISSALRPMPAADGTISDVSWASYFVTHFERIPGMHRALAKPFGLSYARDIFEHHGLFDETLRTGEDSLFNMKISGSMAVYCNDDVVTFHRYPDGFLHALRVQYLRGRRESLYYRQIYSRNQLIVAGRSCKRLAQALAFVVKRRNLDIYRSIFRSIYIAVPLSLSRVLGNLSPVRSAR